jgi:hypothetical protein
LLKNSFGVCLAPNNQVLALLFERTAQHLADQRCALGDDN